MVCGSYLLFSSHGPPILPSFSPLSSSPPPPIPLPFFNLLFILFQPSGLCRFSPHPILKLLPLLLDFPDSSISKESACNAGRPSLIPGLGKSSGEWIGYSLQYSWASLVTQPVKNPPAMWETWVPSLGWEDPLEKGKATHSSILFWRISWSTVHGVAKSGTQLSDFHFT